MWLCVGICESVIYNQNPASPLAFFFLLLPCCSPSDHQMSPDSVWSFPVLLAMTYLICQCLFYFLPLFILLALYHCLMFLSVAYSCPLPTCLAFPQFRFFRFRRSNLDSP